jgi:hypothetical protein
MRIAPDDEVNLVGRGAHAQKRLVQPRVVVLDLSAATQHLIPVPSIRVRNGKASTRVQHIKELLSFSTRVNRVRRLGKVPVDAPADASRQILFMRQHVTNGAKLVGFLSADRQRLTATHCDIAAKGGAVDGCRKSATHSLKLHIGARRPKEGAALLARFY